MKIFSHNSHPLLSFDDGCLVSIKLEKSLKKDEDSQPGRNKTFIETPSFDFIEECFVANI